MQFSIPRENFLKPLQIVVGAVEKNHSMPVLANVLIKADGDQITLITTDLEIELRGTGLTETMAIAGETTVPARKLLEICKALPAGQSISFVLQDENLLVTCGKSRFKLATLPADEFPTVSSVAPGTNFSISGKKLKTLLESVSFSMAMQDVRYYLNGIFITISSSFLIFVTTDGHRLSFCQFQQTIEGDPTSLILPRKAVVELSRLLGHEDQELTVSVTNNHLMVFAQDFSFITKLIDGSYPDYKKVIPRNLSKEIIIDRDQFKQALLRSSILCNEKFRGVMLHLDHGKLVIESHNSLHEEAHEEIEVDYSGSAIEFGFNVTYLLDILGALPNGNIKLLLNDSNTSMQIEAQEANGCLYVVMPMKI